MLKTAIFDTPPPGAGVNTVTLALPAFTISELPILTVKDELLANVVGRAAPFHNTSDLDVKLWPVTVSVKPAPPEELDDGLRAVIVGDGALAGADNSTLISLAAA